MHPVLFELGRIPVTSYGLFLTLAFAAGIAVARRTAPREGLADDVIVELSLVILVSSLLGARLLFALEHPDVFRAPDRSGLDVLRPLLKSGSRGELGGLSMSGGVALAALASLAWLRLRGRPVLRVVDVVAPSIPLGEAITRIGCLLNGCCFGVACDLPWGVRFPSGSPAHAALGDVPLHPTQLYTAAGALLLFFGLRALARRPGVRARPGLVFAGLLIGLPALRLLVDPWRYYPTTGYAIAEWGPLHVWPHDPLVVAMLAAGATLAGVVSASSARRAQAIASTPDSGGS